MTTATTTIKMGFDTIEINLVDLYFDIEARLLLSFCFKVENVIKSFPSNIF